MSENKGPRKSLNKIIYVAAARLRIHPTAQRDGLIRSKLQSMERSLDLDAIGTIHAVEYAIHGETALWVIDGQHRVVALLNAGMGEWEVRVEVHVGVTTDARASDLFLKLNNRSAAAPFEKFRNEVQAKYAAALNIVDIAARYGLTISPSASDGHLTCVVTLQSMYALNGGVALDQALSLITSAWGTTPSALEGKLVEGVARVFAKYGSAVDVPSLRKKLAKVPAGPSGILGRARGMRDTYGRPIGRCVADIVVDLHDRGRRSGTLGVSE